MKCLKCNYDSGGNRKALATHYKEEHGGVTPRGFSVASVFVNKESTTKRIISSPLLALDGVDPEKANQIERMGYNTLEKVAKAKLKDLKTIEGIGEATAKKIVNSAKEKVAQRGSRD